MEKNKKEIIVVGNYHYYAVNDVAKDMLNLIKRKSFSKPVLDILSKYFSISIIHRGDVKAFDER